MKKSLLMLTILLAFTTISFSQVKHLESIIFKSMRVVKNNKTLFEKENTQIKVTFHENGMKVYSTFFDKMYYTMNLYAYKTMYIDGVKIFIHSFVSDGIKYAVGIQENKYSMSIIAGDEEAIILQK